MTVTPPPYLSGSELLGQYFENERTINDLQKDSDNARTIAQLRAEIDDLRRQLNNNNNYGGKKRSNRRTRKRYNKRTIKGSRMHKRMH